MGLGMSIPNGYEFGIGNGFFGNNFQSMTNTQLANPNYNFMDNSSLFNMGNVGGDNYSFQSGLAGGGFSSPYSSFNGYNNIGGGYNYGAGSNNSMSLSEYKTYIKEMNNFRRDEAIEARKSAAELRKIDKTLALQENLTESSIAQLVSNVQSFIAADEKDAAKDSYNKLVAHLQNQTNDPLNPDSKLSAKDAKLLANQLYAQYTGENISDAIDTNCTNAFGNGVGKGMSFGLLGDDENAATLNSKVTNTQLPKSKQNAKTAGVITGYLLDAGIVLGSIMALRYGHCKQVGSKIKNFFSKIWNAGADDSVKVAEDIAEKAPKNVKYKEHWWQIFRKKAPENNDIPTPVKSTETELDPEQAFEKLSDAE